MSLKVPLIEIVLAAALAGCGTIVPSQQHILSGSPPDYRQIIVRDLRSSLNKSSPKMVAGDGTKDPEEIIQGTFLNAAHFGRVEISGLSQTAHNTLGVVWFACLRSYPAVGRLTDYAVFMSNVRILDARSSVLTDNCGDKQYAPLMVVPPFRVRTSIY